MSVTDSTIPEKFLNALSVLKDKLEMFVNPETSVLDLFFQNELTLKVRDFNAWVFLSFPFSGSLQVCFPQITIFLTYFICNKEIKR